QVLTIHNQQSPMSAKAYNYTSLDTSYASTYNDTNKTLKITNPPQSLTYYFTHLKPPTLTLPNQTTQLRKTINPLLFTTTHNPTPTLTNTLTRLPSPLTYHTPTNSIIRTPTKIP
ncbi:hypothetical protein, partial [Staphylococcus aureus]|uniref:hypothetical protein n=1 Tax=Staphylococcus aureus TaxID=1280 RepID=UPI0021B2307F